MIIALAQIDGRLGDIEGICDRIEEQARLAHEAGARVLATPTPLFGGIAPGALVESADYLHDLLSGLARLARSVEPICLVPAVVPYGDSTLFEVFMLKEGRVIPTRTVTSYRRGPAAEELWYPPVFDVDGVRIGVTFDVRRDVEHVPTGTDLMLYFQVNGFDMTDEATAAVASVKDGHFSDLAEKHHVWIACMAPIGAFEDAAYTGGSFVMDDNGRVCAMAPCFEEGLLLQEIRRDRVMPALGSHELPAYRQEAWTWEALVLYLRDTFAAQGASRACVLLAGDLPTSLAAALAVDALGSANVTGVFVARDRIFTPAQEAAEQERASRVRELARNLHIDLVEKDAPRIEGALGSRAALKASAEAAAACHEAEQALVNAVARSRGARVVSPLTKTDYALVGVERPYPREGAVAPFGDVYLTQLEFLARYRNGMSPVVPGPLVTLNAVEERMRVVLAGVYSSFAGMPQLAEPLASVLAQLEATQVDSILDAHVDRNRGAGEIASPALPAEAVRLLLMHVRRGEALRRMLPPYAIVSARSLAERGWPAGLAWSDMGCDADEPMTVDGLAQAEIDRFRQEAGDPGEHVRGEIMSLLGDLFGLSSEEQEQLRSEEGQQRLREGIERFEQELRRAMGSGGGAVAGPPFMQGQGPAAPDGTGFPFFSLN